MNFSTYQIGICHRLQIEDFRFVEIESKKRVLPEQMKELKRFLTRQKKTSHEKAAFFFDQFLDTPGMDVFNRGASLRIRYKGNGSKVYLQYKGPGFIEDGLLFRSEFSSAKLEHLIREESHHDIIHFTEASVRQILARHVHPAMAQAMRAHLGTSVIARLSKGPILSIYQKEKFKVNLGSAFLEPSLDRIFAFHISPSGTHPLSSFCEYENEIKASGQSLNAKLKHIPELLKFDQKVTKEFNLKPERLDKYHRCTSIFHSHKKK